MENELLENIILITSSKLHIEVEDNIVKMAVEESIVDTLNYCNRKDVPPALKYLISNIALERINQTYTKKEKEVKSIQQGDSTVTFSEPPKEEIDYNVMQKYYKELNRFRKLSK